MGQRGDGARGETLNVLDAFRAADAAAAAAGDNNGVVDLLDAFPFLTEEDEEAPFLPAFAVVSASS